MKNLLKNRSVAHVLMLHVLLIIDYNTVDFVFCNEINRPFVCQNTDLAIRINFAKETALREFDGGKIWLIYSINSSKMDLERFAAADLSNNSLYQLLFESAQPSNKKGAALSRHNDRHKMSVVTIPPGNSEDRHNKDEANHIGHSNRMAIILDYSLESGRPILYQVCFQNISKTFNQELRPIIWIGNATTIQSFAWLVHQFSKSTYEKLRQQIINAIGFHDCEMNLVDFSKKILNGRYPQSLKVTALSLVGKSNTTDGLKLLISIAINNNNVLLRKRALFSLSQLNNPKAHLVIAAMAKKEKNDEVRKEAIFWLSQIANQEAIKILSEIMQKETDPKIREYTLFAISQLPGSQSKPILTTVATNDPLYRIRKKARLIMKQSEDSKFMIFFDELVGNSDAPK